MHRIIEQHNADAPSVAAYVPREYAARLIAIAGGEQISTGQWVVDDTAYWEIDEALLVALGIIADREDRS